MVYAHVSSQEDQDLCTRSHTDTDTDTDTHTSQMKKQAASTLYHLYPNVHSIRYAYMVLNTSDIIYSVNKHCQVELNVCDIKYLSFKL